MYFLIATILTLSISNNCRRKLILLCRNIVVAIYMLRIRKILAPKIKSYKWKNSLNLRLGSKSRYTHVPHVQWTLIIQFLISILYTCNCKLILTNANVYSIFLLLLKQRSWRKEKKVANWFSSQGKDEAGWMYFLFKISKGHVWLQTSWVWICFTAAAWLGFLHKAGHSRKVCSGQ